MSEKEVLERIDQLEAKAEESRQLLLRVQEELRAALGKVDSFRAKTARCQQYFSRRYSCFWFHLTFSTISGRERVGWVCWFETLVSVFPPERIVGEGTTAEEALDDFMRKEGIE